MVARPVRALLDSESVGEVMVLSQDPERIAAAIPAGPRVSHRRSKRTIAETMLELVEDPSVKWPLLVTTGDHALLDKGTVDEFCASATGRDIAIGVVERAHLLRRLGKVRRTWLRFRGGAYTGANLFGLASPRVAPAIELWRSIEQDRKKGLRLTGLLGPTVLLGAALRLLTIDQVVERVALRLKLSIKVVRLGNALAGVDVDKMDDHALAEAIIQGQR